MRTLQVFIAVALTCTAYAANIHVICDLTASNPKARMFKATLGSSTLSFSQEADNAKFIYRDISYNSNDTSLYLPDFYSKGIQKFPESGGSVSMGYLHETYIDASIVERNMLYFSDWNKKIYKVDLSAASPSATAIGGTEPGRVMSMALGDGKLYMTMFEGHVIKSIDLSSDSNALNAPALFATPSETKGLAYAGGYLYYGSKASGEAGPGAVYRKSTSNGSTTDPGQKLCTYSGSAPVALAVSGSDVYFLGHDEGVLKVSKDSTGVPCSPVSTSGLSGCKTYQGLEIV